MSSPLLELKNICLSLNASNLLKSVNFTLQKGEIHGLVGANGAGKSLLMQLIYGTYQPDSGSYIINGEKAEVQSPKDAQRMGITALFQDMNLVDELSVAENIFIGRYPENRFKKVNWRKLNNSAAEILRKLNINIPEKKLVKNLSFTNKRLVEIAKALSFDPKILILDEPLAAVSEGDISSFFPALFALKKLGVGIIYISHKLEHVLRISDSLTVIRNGSIIKNYFNNAPDLKSLAEEMSDRSGGTGVYPKIAADFGRVILKVENISTDRRLRNISFSLRRGEILGIAGLVNSGRTALARAVFGLDRLNEGSIYVDGHRLQMKSPEDAIKARIGYLPEDRLSEGLVANISIPANITLSNIEEIIKFQNLGLKRETAIAFDYFNKFNIKVPRMSSSIRELSGGNQQKIHISKWLFANTRILILEEPTHAIDISSKLDIYNYMRHYVNRGSSIILISSDINELVGLSDRIQVLNSGRFCKEYHKTEFSVEKILYHAAGGE